jgi:hypothetical protein
MPFWKKSARSESAGPASSLLVEALPQLGLVRPISIPKRLLSNDGGCGQLPHCNYIRELMAGSSSV